MSRKNSYMSAEERKAVTVQTVIDLSAQQNPAEITTNDIAKKMGLTQGALFRHFPTKENLIEATLQWVSDKLLKRIDKAISKETLAVDALRAMFLTHIDFVYKHPGVPRMLFGELQKTNDSITKKMVQTLLVQYQDRLEKIFKKAVANNELSSDIDIETASILFIGVIQGFVVRSMISNKQKNIKEVAPKAFEIYIKGLGK